MTPDEVHEKWKDWIFSIRHEVLRLYLDRDMWKATRQALLDAGGDGVFLRHYALLYAEAQALGIRRLVRPNKDSISLGRLLRELANRPDVATKQRYLACVRSGEDGAVPAFIMEHEAAYFDHEFGTAAGGLDIARIRAHAVELNQAADSAMGWADRMVAHLDTRGFDGHVTWKDLDDALDLVGEMFKRYDKLVTASHWDSLRTYTTDWQAPLRRGLSFRDEAQAG